MMRFKLFLLELLFMSGVSLICFGLWLINPILAFIGAGAFVMLIASKQYGNLKGKGR